MSANLYPHWVDMVIPKMLNEEITEITIPPRISPISIEDIDDVYEQLTGLGYSISHALGGAITFDANLKSHWDMLFNVEESFAIHSHDDYTTLEKFMNQMTEFSHACTVIVCRLYPNSCMEGSIRLFLILVKRLKPLEILFNAGYLTFIVFKPS
ncbi:MAG: hypothetical protein Sylvanvirus3_6 [Sylvanvirus sp.]|uniref:Uncharacterized protein n=1 Tax=Sylvanvirus sp. TaxID=2487774 RepID=A0A3G5AH67_9VIRU|nr:MAG: hypothetical protein Sylvanvirus3_6 [Sylvanvirus sp.]